MLRISDRVKLGVAYRDRTPAGSAVTHACDKTLRAACKNVVAFRREHGLERTVEKSVPLLREAGISEFFERPGRLRHEVLFPPAELVSVDGVRVEFADKVPAKTFRVTEALAQDLARWTGDWARGESRAPVDGEARQLWQWLVDQGVFTEEAAQSVTDDRDATFVGHASVAVHTPRGNLLVDPVFSAQSGHYPKQYQPTALSEVQPVVGALVTHSHPDHFEPGDLLRLGADTPIAVPEVERESLLSVDMGGRLEGLGFTNVVRLRWFESAVIGGCTVTALPFYGEQPTVSHRFHESVRNVGNTYLIDTGERRFLFTADAGRDVAGDTVDMSALARREMDPVDVVFGGHRGFAIFPIQFIFSAVARYLLFVPEESWLVRQQLMADAEDLVTIAEVWGARTVIPYAGGGAPWHWEQGLGPSAVDGRSSPLDPPPESVADACAQRSGVRGIRLASPVSGLVARPGDGLRFASAQHEVLRAEPHHWPYG